MRETATSIDEYIARFPAERQAILNAVRKAIRESAPGAEEAIRYSMPTFRLEGKNLVHFAAFQNHVGFFPTSSGVAAFSEELRKYKTSKGTIQLPLDQPMPLALIRKITRFRVREVLAGERR